MRLLPVLASAAAVIGLAAPAQADANQDQAFLSALGAAGITYQNADDAVATGKKVCEMANAGKSGVEVVKYLQDQNPGFAQDKAAKFTAIAADAYCPQQLADSPKGGSGGG